MSRTYRKVPPGNPFRKPKTFNELKQVLCDNDSEYHVSTRKRYIPTAWDDIIATSIYQSDHHHQ